MKNSKRISKNYCQQDEITYLLEKIINKKKDDNPFDKKIIVKKDNKKQHCKVIFLNQFPKKESKPPLVFNLSDKSSLSEEERNDLKNELDKTFCFIENIIKEENY